ncbi:MAG: acetate/propionate family kinase [Deltaproteobacteria bacterium HGW-Deltaproteobacteria-13]|jgi:acetate kinase|nr:MAG: acetate/propionate family kinase [Deltaproteobacteria bacterium HGW-Deltaproteobacteria-13]
MPNHYFCINCGSSSIKFALYYLGVNEEIIAQGAVEGIGLPDGWLWLNDGAGNRLSDLKIQLPDNNRAIELIFRQVIEKHNFPAPDAVGHRLAHGGPDHLAPEIVTPSLMKELNALISLAPIHLPGELSCIEAVSEHYPQLTQVVCFDTFFHHQMPEMGKLLPLDYHLKQEGIHRYGFHGLSYEYITGILGASVHGRVIIAHLGSGSSMTALKDGAPQDTTMGFSPLGGLMMGTRCGDLDPGIILYLMDEKGYDLRHLEKLLYQHSGLIGVSGISSDAKTLLEQQNTEPHAAQAIELFCYTARKDIGALSAVLGGLDTLVFTGGIGERAAPVRWSICDGLEYLGLKLDSKKNNANADTISTNDSACSVRVIPTNEDLMIARHTRALLLKRR